MQLEKALSMTEIVREQQELIAEQQQTIRELKQAYDTQNARAESFLKELTRLEQETKKLKENSSTMTSTLTEWEGKYNMLLKRLQKLENTKETLSKNNEVLTKKLTALETNSTAYEKELSKLETASGRGSAGQSRPNSQTTAQDLLARIRNQ